MRTLLCLLDHVKSVFEIRIDVHFTGIRPHGVRLAPVEHFLHDDTNRVHVGLEVLWGGLIRHLRTRLDHVGHVFMALPPEGQAAADVDQDQFGVGGVEPENVRVQVAVHQILRVQEC